MIKRILVWLPLVFSGAFLLAESASSCTAQALRDAADELDGTPQTLGDVGSLDDFSKWFENQFDGK
jgi:hypothetical protein